MSADLLSSKAQRRDRTNSQVLSLSKENIFPPLDNSIVYVQLLNNSYSLPP